MTSNEIDFFIKKYEGFIPINKFLIKKLGLVATVMYSELINRYKYFKRRNTLKMFAGKNYFFNTIEDLESSIGLSAHQQRKAIQILIKNKLIKIKYGQGNIRYFHIEEDMENLKNIAKSVDNNTPF